MVMRKDKRKVIDGDGLETTLSETVDDKLKKDVYTALNAFGEDENVPYPDIRKVLVEKYPKKYSELSNTAIKRVCMVLASEDKVIWV